MIELRDVPQIELRDVSEILLPSPILLGEGSGVRVLKFGSNFRLSNAMIVSNSRNATELAPTLVPPRPLLRPGTPIPPRPFLWERGLGGEGYRLEMQTSHVPYSNQRAIGVVRWARTGMRGSLFHAIPAPHPPTPSPRRRGEGEEKFCMNSLRSSLTSRSSYPRPLSHKNGRGEVRVSTRIARAVTVIEVLFAMVVMLVGLVGMAALLPMAGRQASDSYSLTHASAAMQNVRASVASMDILEPTPERPWWFADDEYATAPTTNLGFGFPMASERRWYRSARSMSEILLFVKQRQMPGALPATLAPADYIRLELARRNGRAQGFCIDPTFCGTEIGENWSNTGYAGAYQHDRGGSQGVFRRSRMPFFDEHTELGASGFASNASYFFPKLMRVSFQGKTISTRFSAPPEPLPMSRESSGQFSMPGGDLVKADQKDKSFGAIRYFDWTASQGYSSSPLSRRISWLASMTPSERSSPDTDPTTYNLSVAVFGNRDQVFSASPLAVTGDAEFAAGEKMCFATSPTATSVAITQLGDLAFSHTGGAFQVQLWSDSLTNPKIKVGEWAMMSRRIVLGNNTGNIEDLKIIHRHRWYRIIGVQPPPATQTTAWPITVRLQGEPWDYPEMNSVMQPAGNYSSQTVGTGLDGISAVPGTTNGQPGSYASGVNLVDLATTVTLFQSVVSVYQREITLP